MLKGLANREPRFLNLGDGGNDLVGGNKIPEKVSLERKTQQLTFVMSPGRVAIS